MHLVAHRSRSGGDYKRSDCFIQISVKNYHRLLLGSTRCIYRFLAAATGGLAHSGGIAAHTSLQHHMITAAVRRDFQQRIACILTPASNIADKPGIAGGNVQFISGLKRLHHVRYLKYRSRTAKSTSIDRYSFVLGPYGIYSELLL